MKSSKLGMISIVLLVCIFAFWSDRAESGSPDMVKDSANKQQEIGEEAINPGKTVNELHEAQATSASTEQGTASATTPAIGDFDIVGLKLGMTLSEAESILQKHSNEYIVHPINSKNDLCTRRQGEPLGGCTGLRADSESNKESIIIYHHTRSADPPIHYIEQTITFPTLEAAEIAKNNLYKRYGNPTYSPPDKVLDKQLDSVTKYLHWSFNSGGKFVNNKVCSGGRPSSFLLWMSRYSGVPFSRKCRILLEVMLPRDNWLKLRSSLRTLSEP